MNTLTLQPANATIQFNLESLMQEVNEIIRQERVILKSKKVLTGAQLSRIQKSKSRVAIRTGFVAYI